KFIQDALKAAVSQVDAHSSFFMPKSYKSMMESTKGEFSGIGVSVITKNPEDETLDIIDVIEDGPAFKAGLETGDKIVEVNGEKLKGLSGDEVVNLLKGKTGTVVTIKLIRKKKPLEFKVVRSIIKDQTSSCYFFEEQNVYYVMLKVFNEVAAEQVRDILQKANKGKCKGIVLDLRRNPGGTLDSAIEMAGLFVNKGSLVVSTRDNNGKLIAEYRTTQDPVLASDVPIFIMVDNFTASASEILAGALRYHSNQTDKHKHLKVFLIGTETFGKGSVQELIPIKNDCALKLTTMLYYLPINELIQAIGIKPDFTILPKITPSQEMKWVNELYGKESSLKSHITLAEVQNKAKEEEKENKTGFWSKLFKATEDTGFTDVAKAKKDKPDNKDPKEDKESWEKKQRESISHDVQVQASVSLINLFDFAKKNGIKAIETRAGAITFLRKNFLTDDDIKVVKIR
ncbi:MAG: S41 family peptidase, partial [bacterium]